MRKILILLTIIALTGCSSNTPKDKWQTAPIIKKIVLPNGTSYIVPQDDKYNWMFYSETEVDINADNLIQILQDKGELLAWRDNYPY